MTTDGGKGSGRITVEFTTPARSINHQAKHRRGLWCNSLLLLLLFLSRLRVKTPSIPVKMLATQLNSSRNRLASYSGSQVRTILQREDFGVGDINVLFARESSRNPKTLFGRQRIIVLMLELPEPILAIDSKLNSPRSCFVVCNSNQR